MLILFTVGSCGKAPKMPEYKTNSIELLDPNDQTIFFLLPLQGRVKNNTKFWSGDYWALNRGNINIRWNAPDAPGFNLDSPSKEAVAGMSYEELAQLSPTEKFDLYLGRYDYPLREEVYTEANPRAMSWEGICNGWAPASMNHNEPTPKALYNPDGILIPFGSSDIKALLSYYYAFIHKIENTQQMGRRCPRGRWFNWNQDCYNDLNPGPFHIILANKIGIQNKSFLVDIDRYKEVWNHPILSYYSQNMGDVALSGNEVTGTARVLKIRTRITYIDGSEKNTWDPIIGTAEQKTVNREYAYHLYLDRFNNIIGGEWKSNDRPDFLWMMGPTKKFEGLMDGLRTLLND